MNQTFDPLRESRRGASRRTLAALGRELWPADRPDLKLRLLLAGAALLLAKLASIATPYAYKLAVDSLAPGGVLREGWRAALPIWLLAPAALTLAYAASRLISQAAGELRDFLFARNTQHAQRKLALRVFEHLHRLSLQFHLSRQTGGLSRVIERGVKGVHFVLSFLTFSIAPTILEIIVVAVVLGRLFGWQYAAIVCGAITLYVVYTLLITEWRTIHRRRMNESDNRAHARAIDSLLNFETVKYFGAEQREYQRFDESLASYEQSYLRSQTSLSLLNVGQALIIAGGLASLMILAAQGVQRGERTLGDFVMVNAYLIQLYMPLNFLGFVYRELKQGLVDMDKMIELLAIQPEVQDVVGAPPLSPAGGRIEFDQVSFSYGPEREILRGLNFCAEPGQTVAIVGPSGAGKSTIARLIFRFYDVSEGAIRLDGQDIREVAQHSLRAALGVVPQDCVLFNDSIGYNIGYGRDGATRREIEEAARMASIDAFIQSLPQGYDTPVGERGLKLSGGEKQRVAIARTMLKGPEILIFDEATSALDSHTEKDIQAALREVSRNRTTLVIAHRLSTVVDADQILVLKQGQIVERGRHQQLLQLDGEYAAMWNKQREADEMRSRLDAALADAGA
ncbi:MAG: ABC transporter ATP-binding protein/permease [Leptospirales bacterium]|nr:ABC transporter ATP-binding protein/permease [Leptospirales bacterium]